MGRPAKNNAEYFPHANGLRNHRKVKMLRNKFGSVMGYAFWCLMLEWLTEHDGLEWEYSEIEIEMFSSELGVSAAEIPPMVDYCVKIGLLSRSASDFIYSESLNENLKVVFDKRKREREKSKDRKRKEDGTFIPEKPTSDGVSAADSPQSKVEYSKVEYSKEDIHTIPESVPVRAPRKKKSDPKKEVPTLFASMNEYWLKQLHPGWTYTAVHGQKMKSLITKTKSLLKSLERGKVGVFECLR